MKIRCLQNNLTMAGVILVFSGFCVFGDQSGQQQPSGQSMVQTGLLNQLAMIQNYENLRASSTDPDGGNTDMCFIDAGKTHILLEEKGAGCIKHIYWTYILPDEDIRLDLFSGLRFKAFWDGADSPSIDVPIGDFFGVANGLVRPIQSLAFIVNYGYNPDQQVSWAFNCYLPMPFAKGARIELDNDTPGSRFPVYYHIDYEKYDSADIIPHNVGRLHAQWNRTFPTKAVPQGSGNLKAEGNYDILNIQGNGKIVGFFLTIVNHKLNWYGEGDDMIFIDGKKYEHAILGTGTEEIFGGGACPATEYTGLYTGFHCIQNLGTNNYIHSNEYHNSTKYGGTNGMYRFYINDPLRFKNSIRMSIEHGHKNDLENDYRSVVFWYEMGLNKNVKTLPEWKQRRFSKPKLYWNK